MVTQTLRRRPYCGFSLLRASLHSQGIDMNVSFRLAALLIILSPASYAQEFNDCKLQYPIVLSHHFGLRTICPDSWTAGQLTSA